MTAERIPIVILGAGPAGLGAAWRLARRGIFDVSVIERGSTVGGNAGSFDFSGMLVDYGSHRLHPSCAPEILSDIRGMLGDDLLDRPRHGRIRLRGRWVHFPLKAADLALHLPPSFITGVGVDAVKKLRRSSTSAETFATVLEKGLGHTICRDFYFPYARKIWGVDPGTLDAEQARRRVSAGSLAKMVRKVLNSVPGFSKKKGGRFYYPKRGFGAISQAFATASVKSGACLKLHTSVVALESSKARVSSVRITSPAGEETIEARQILSTIPVTQLVRLVSSDKPKEVIDSARALKFRAMILIYLLLDTPQFTEYDAHYFPDADIAITRLSEPKNYSLADFPGRTVLCAELPCSTDDPVWGASDAELADIVTRALAKAAIPVRVPILAVASRKLPQAYPIYTRDYPGHFTRVDEWVGGIDGVITFGRQGLFAHDNTHHALAMAYDLDRCLRDDGSFDKERWHNCRLEFQRHVVED